MQQSDNVVRIPKSDADLIASVVETEIERIEYVFERADATRRMTLSAKIVRLRRIVDKLKGMKS